MKLTVKIDGKAALPVRAIPYASGDPFRLIPPWRVPFILAGEEGLPRSPDDVPRAFCVGARGVELYPPIHWHACQETMRKLIAQEGLHGAGRVRACIQHLPPDLFVWFDEFNEWQQWTLGLVPYNSAYYPEEMRIEGWDRWERPAAVRRPPLCTESFVPADCEPLLTEGLKSFARTRSLREAEPITTPSMNCASGSQQKIGVEQGEDITDTNGLVAWQRVLIDCWPKIIAARKDEPSARDAMAWLKKNGPRDVIPAEQPDSDGMRWLGHDGTIHTVMLKTIQSRFSEWKKSGKFPA